MAPGTGVLSNGDASGMTGGVETQISGIERCIDAKCIHESVLGSLPSQVKGKKGKKEKFNSEGIEPKQCCCFFNYVKKTNKHVFVNEKDSVHKNSKGSTAGNTWDGIMP